MKTDVLSLFRLVAFIEGISYLLIFFIGYPFKFIWNNPLPMRIVGMSHGVLFILFCLLLFFVFQKYKWSVGKAAFALLLSFIPLGTFYMEYRMKKNTW